MTEGHHADRGLDGLFALDLFPVGVFQTDLLGRCLRVNPRWCALAGRTAEEAHGYGYLDAIHPDDRPRVIEATRQHIETDRPLRIEYRIVRPNGEVRWVLAQATALHGPGGERTGYLGTVTDITGRIEAEQALRESEERYRNLIELNPDLVTVHRGGVMLYVNEAGLRMMRAREPSDMVGHHILEFVRPEFRDLAVDRMRRLAAGEPLEPAEMEITRCDGTTAWIETVASRTVYGGEPAVQLWARDITERRKVEVLYRAVVESVRDPIWIADRDDAGAWRLVFANAAYCRGARVELADILGKTSMDLAAAGYLSERLAREREQYYRQAAEAGRAVEYEMRGEWNGRPFHIMTTLTPVAGQDGVCRRIVGWSRDLSRRLEQERRLAESERNYRAVVEGTSDALWVAEKEPDGGWRIALANARAAEILQLPLERLTGRRVEEALPPEAARRALERYRQAEAAGGPIEYENVIERPGYRREVVTHLTPVFDEAGRCVRIIGSARDAADRRKAELALLQAQKLESLGVLAGGIAHDFNNLLTTILGNLFLVRTELPPDSPLRVYLDDAALAGERGAELVRKLLSFSRPGIAARERVSLTRLFDETVALVRRTLTPAIQLAVHSEPGDDTVIGEFAGLQQVLLNLLLNARDAMPEGGTVTILRRTRELGPDPAWARRGLLPGVYHEVAVSDTGTGMPPELLSRIFDPFFTTKGIGKGTGLGLSTALSIVRAHGGWLEAESVEGQGSTFRILLPVAPPPGEEPPAGGR
ncbi:PAS domain S-box protein [Tepidiforma sp.]|jgi:PAS domain S-box-containing protein|uniref:PAS domain S-box protein n=1 Tax=Tepidiforma sp. TaxID=2682230 RepID=UPI00260CF27F|nr:PAS domain S-box protein [Tepidiforma sp.]MCX7619071.1 PAS domain S-box protein [Tepidiforma sp.]